MPSRLNLFLILFGLVASLSLRAEDKLTGAVGFFSINAKASGQSSSISNPSALNVGYLKPLSHQFEFRINYSLLLADFAGSDMGYGLNVGFNYYPFTGTSDQRLRTDSLDVITHEPYRPYVGAVFAQRSFQSIRNSFAGFGFVGGVEKYYDKKMNLYTEVSYLSLSGSGLSTATEIQAVVGVVFKL
jgi:hypothetical protein